MPGMTIRLRHAHLRSAAAACRRRARGFARQDRAVTAAAVRAAGTACVACEGMTESSVYCVAH